MLANNYPKLFQTSVFRPPGSPQVPKKDIFAENSGYYSNGKRQMNFMNAMNYFSKMDAPHVTKAFDLNEFDSVCDLGGKAFQSFHTLLGFFYNRLLTCFFKDNVFSGIVLLLLPVNTTELNTVLIGLYSSLVHVFFIKQAALVLWPPLWPLITNTCK